MVTFRFEQRKHGFPLLNDEKVLKKKRKLLVSENDESGYVMTSDDQVKNGMKKQRGIKKEVLNDISKNVTHMPKLLSQDTPSKSDDLPKKSKRKSNAFLYNLKVKFQLRMLLGSYGKKLG